MIPNHVELELLAKDIHESRIRQADAVRLIETARGMNPNEQRSQARLWIVNSGSRVRWWFRSRALCSQAAVASSTPLAARSAATTISRDTVSDSGAMLPADSYAALMVIARGPRQRHERIATQRS